MQTAPDCAGFQPTAGLCAGSPKWSPDGKQVVFYELPVESTWDAHRASGDISDISDRLCRCCDRERIEQTSGPGIKISPQLYLRMGSVSLQKVGPRRRASLHAEQGKVNGQLAVAGMVARRHDSDLSKGHLRVPPPEHPLYSWDPNYEYRYTDMFPQLLEGRQAGSDGEGCDSSIVIMNPDGSDKAARLLRRRQGACLCAELVT